MRQNLLAVFELYRELPAMKASSQHPGRWMTGFFLILFLAMGVFQISTLPPFQIPDENTHWINGLNRVHRALGGNGPLCSTEISLVQHFIDPLHPYGAPPKSIAPDRIAELKPECGSAEIPYGSALTYPQLWVSHAYHRWIDNKSPTRTLGVARFSAGMLVLLAAVAAALAAQRSANPGATGALWVSYALLLSPIALQQSFAVSPDVAALAYAILLTSLLTAGESWTPAHWSFFALISAAAIPAKPFLALLALPGLWLKPLRSRAVRAAAVILFVSGIVLGLSAQAPHTSGPHADSALQKSLILKSPLQTAWLIAKTTAKKAGFYNHWLLARLGWLDHTPSAFTYSAYVLFLAMTFWLALGRSCFNNSTRPHWSLDLLTVGVWFGAASLITLLLYLVWTPPGSDGVIGLQGRYFLPLHLVLIGYLWSRFSSTRPNEDSVILNERSKFAAVATIGLFYAIGLMLDNGRFYIQS
jgi:hypothetical protein